MERAGIVHIDERLLVINKPPGLSLATPRADPKAAVRRILDSLLPAERDSLGDTTENLWLVHRLDVGTSGLVMLARDSETHKLLTRELAGHRIEKTYLALVWGHLRPKEGLFDWPIGPDRRDRRRMRVDPEGRRALTRYRTIADAPHVGLLELQPETGRTHQIRVHLAHAGHWIVGDDLYAGARHHGVRQAHMRQALNPGHLLLHAWKLRLPAEYACGEPEAALPSTFARTIAALGISAPELVRAPGAAGRGVSSPARTHTPARSAGARCTRVR